jgi:hypothetical protein
MHWWKKIIESIKAGDVLDTPGKGMNGGNSGKFKINSIDSSKIVISSGNTSVHLEKECFDVLEVAFAKNPNLWLRCASSHSNEAFANSADMLIRERTGSQLARGNYVCSMLEKAGLVKYSMRDNKKWIKLS